MTTILVFDAVSSVVLAVGLAAFVTLTERRARRAAEQILYVNRTPRRLPRT
jgi:hypothetical protein